MLLCSYVLCLLRDQWLIERLSEAMGAALVSTNLSPIPWKISFHMKKKSDSLLFEIYKALKPYSSCWLLNWVSIARVIAFFPQENLSLPAATAADSEAVFVLARLTRTRRAEELPKELGCWFCPLNLWLPSGTAFREISRLWWPAGAQTWTQTWTLLPESAAWPTSCKGFIASKINT